MYWVRDYKVGKGTSSEVPFSFTPITTFSGTGTDKKERFYGIPELRGILCKPISCTKLIEKAQYYVVFVKNHLVFFCKLFIIK